MQTIEIKKSIEITKINAEKRLVYGIVYEPDVRDAEGDSASAPEIEKAAHGFMIDFRTLGYMHKRKLDKQEAEIVESFVAPATFEMGKKVVTRGTWVMVVKVFDDSIWKEIKTGKITGFSMAGHAQEAA